MGLPILQMYSRIDLESGNSWGLWQ